jgi:hypothetical protein
VLTNETTDLATLREALPPIVDVGIRLWQQARLDADQLALLRNVSIDFAALDGLYLGLTTGNTILLDTNDVGFGRYIDAPPRSLPHGDFTR